MKKLFFISLLFLTACVDTNWINVDSDTLKFKAGESVKISAGFYSECVSGTITGFVQHKKKGEENRYYVKVVCGTESQELIGISESNIERIAK